jgi:hypothetical protein
MTDNIFMAETPRPEESSIQAALGEKFPWYLGALEAAAGFGQDWKYYGAKYGWKLKVWDGSKALFELTVAKGYFRLSMAVREAELEALRADASTAQGLSELLDAGKSKNGWGIRLTINEEAKYEKACALIKAVAALRRQA